MRFPRPRSGSLIGPEVTTSHTPRKHPYKHRAYTNHVYRYKRGRPARDKHVRLQIQRLRFIIAEPDV